MKLKNINLDDLSSLKGRSRISLTCDGCQAEISREVKEIRRCIKEGKKTAFCSNKCQGKQLKINKTKKCEYCENDFEYNFQSQKYCSVSCGNHNRVVSEETKRKISASVSKLPRKIKKTPTKALYNSKKNKIDKKLVGEFSKLYICKCKNCSFIGSYRSQTGYCHNCKHCYTENGRAKFIFTFNVYHYPDLFDLEFINKHGWRKTKGNNININGVSRDHKVSVRDAIKYNYDPYYIKHPLNCEIMLHEQNQQKGTNSSISYEELIKLVDDYESK